MSAFKLVFAGFAFVTALAAAWPATAQTVRTFNFVWASECLSGGAVIGARQGHGLATMTYTATGAELRYSGAGGDSPAPTHITTPSSGAPAPADAVFFPNACGFTDYPPGTFEWRMSFDDPLGFMVGAGFQGGRELLHGVGTGTATTVGASFTAPAEGESVGGTVAVSASVSGVLPGVSLVFRLAVDGREIASQATTTQAATFTWNTTTVAAGAHRLELRVTDKFGTTVALAARMLNVGSSGGSGAVPPPPTSGLRVSFTSPRANASLSGTQVVVHTWVDGASAGTNTFTLAVNGRTVGTAQSCSCTHVWRYWNTTGQPNGTHTLTGTVRDTAGKTGTANMTVLVVN